MSQPDEARRESDTAESPLLTFEEARRYHLEAFAETSVEQRIQWLADMLELMEMARAARVGEGREEAEGRHDDR